MKTLKEMFIKMTQIKHFEQIENDECEPKMYLILREDLAYKYIQGGHALEFPDKFKEWDNKILICLSVFNGLALKELDDKFYNEFGDGKYSIFIEPDLHSLLSTAICIFEDGSGDVSKMLKDLKLATK